MAPRIKYPISIAGKSPDWYNGPELKELAPLYWWWKKWKDENCEYYHNNEWYTNMYNITVLNKTTPKKIESIITEIYPNIDINDVTLLCYERPESFCHRHIVAEWLNKNGYTCVERDFLADENT